MLHHRSTSALKHHSASNRLHSPGDEQTCVKDSQVGVPGAFATRRATLTENRQRHLLASDSTQAQGAEPVTPGREERRDRRPLRPARL